MSRDDDWTRHGGPSLAKVWHSRPTDYQAERLGGQATPGIPLEPDRSWQSALKQLADTLAPGSNVQIDPSDPEESCARIVEEVQAEHAVELAGVLVRLGCTLAPDMDTRINILDPTEFCNRIVNAVRVQRLLEDTNGPTE